MAVYDRKITVGEKKYTFIHYKGDWRVHCLRYEEPWMIYEKGSSAISAIMYDYEQLEAKNKQLKKVIEDFDNKRAGTMIGREFVDLDLVSKFQADSKQLERSEKENEKLREACKAALDYLQLPELTWKENLIDILTEFLACCKD